MKRALFSFLLLTSAHAAAQVEPADRARAAELYREAYATAESNPGLAIDAFRRSYALDPRPQTLYALGQLEIQIGLLADAFAHLSSLLAAPGNLEAARVSSAERLLLRLRPRLAFLVLEVAPTGATVALDDRPLGVAPIETPIAVDPGTHEVQVDAPHHESASTRVSCVAGSTQHVPISLARIAPGVLEIGVTPPPTQILVDGALVPLAREITLESGVHEIELRRAEHRPLRRRLELAPGARIPIRGTLRPLIEPARVTVRSVVGSRLRVDEGALLALPWTGLLAPGRHVLHFRADGFFQEERALTLRPGEVRRLVVPLREVPVTENPWLWVGVGAGVIAVLAVVVGIVLAQPRALVLEPRIDSH